MEKINTDIQIRDGLETFSVNVSRGTCSSLKITGNCSDQMWGQIL